MTTEEINELSEKIDCSLLFAEKRKLQEKVSHSESVMLLFVDDANII